MADLFDKILIANRGEIACRVMRTCQRLGIKTVAVFSDADADALHVALADEAVHIGPAPVAESYLKAATIIAAARETGAQAIHPGYGFLSENADFSEMCEANDITFIGPPADAIQAMGLKGAAKALMVEAGVPVVPGYHGDDQDDALLTQEAERIGYPLLIKAVAGGGGKGMRTVHKAEEFDAALASARREGAAAFGNDKVLLEKFIEVPRHIELQVFADSHGNAVHLFERDCSLQRRHQKVIEEAPAPDMPQAMRDAMGAAAVRAAKAIGYRGAGTIEFIVDVANGLADAPFYFMEMNTRLQVEHPVSEMITGEDLVEWQIRVAAGEPLPREQDELTIDGHAFEVRLYAEDPARDFLPATGTLTDLRFAPEDSFVRIDTGVEEGDSVTVHYDPMIAKIICWGEDRTTALNRLAAALDQTSVAGVTTNLAFLRRIAQNPHFARAAVDTGFIARHSADLMAPPEIDHALAMAMGALGILARREARALDATLPPDGATAGDPFSPWNRVDSWRSNLAAAEVISLLDGETPCPISIERQPDGFHITALDRRFVAALRAYDEATGDLAALINGRTRRARVLADDAALSVILDGVTLNWDRVQMRPDADDEAEGTGRVNAPMPGKVLSVMVEQGQQVARGQALLILEAMKMEHTLVAPRDGIVASIQAQEGAQVSEAAALVVIEEEDGQQ